MPVDVHRVYRVFQDRFRPRRMRKMADMLGINPTTKVLDIGGSELNWSYLPFRPNLTIINIDTDQTTQASFKPVIGDACRLPFGDKTFDLAFSNSVIEHVQDPIAFAEEAVRVGQSYYVQTPSYWFPIEPHFMAPMFHFLPEKWRKKLARRFTGWGILAKPSPSEVSLSVTTTNLLKPKEVQVLFPKARLERETFLGMTKSIIAIGGESK
jgi:SAM-dependent methyltransferase